MEILADNERTAESAQSGRWRLFLQRFVPDAFGKRTGPFFGADWKLNSRQIAVVCGVSLLLVAATRLPLMPSQLYSFDSVNLALALKKFDPNLNQPQPPGYPYFVGEARLLHKVLGTPERTFTALKILISGLSIAFLYFLGRRMISARAGLFAAALLLMNPIMWYAGLTSSLRLHLAFFSILTAYCCWRAWEGNAKYFYAASVVLGVGGGFRPELCLMLLPLWAWTGWRIGKGRQLIRGGILGAAMAAIWIGILIRAYGGPSAMLHTISDYLDVQVQPGSLLLGSSVVPWRRMAGRAIFWNAMGALPWIWTVPILWHRRKQLADCSRHLHFMALWFIPAFLFSLLIHVAAPGHVLASIPPVCLLGAFCIGEAEQLFQFPWISKWKERGFAIWLVLFSSYGLLFLAEDPRQKWLVVWIGLILSLLFLFPRLSEVLPGRQGPAGRGALISLALLANLFLFFAELPLPQREPTGRFRGLISLADLFLFGTYDTSYSKEHWTDMMTSFSISDIAALRANAKGPFLVIWSRDGTPAWRIASYYFPQDRVYALDEEGDPGVGITRARLWTGSTVLSRFTGKPPIRIPVPQGARIVWLMGGGREQELSRIVPLRKSQALYYTDLPSNASSFRWGSFEFVPH